MTQLLGISFLFLLLNCQAPEPVNENKKNVDSNVVKPDSKANSNVNALTASQNFIQPDSSFEWVGSFGITETVLNPAIIVPKARVYTLPDTNSKVITELERLTEIKVLNKGNQIWLNRVFENGNIKEVIDQRMVSWYQIALEFTIGYVKTSEVASHCAPPYYIVSEIYEAPRFYGSFKVYKYHYNGKTPVDSLLVSSFNPEKIKCLYWPGLKNASAILIAEDLSHQCGGTNRCLFIADINNKLVKLDSTFSYGDDGGEGDAGSEIWLPYKCYNKKIIMVPNGVIEEVVNGYDGEVRIFNVPESINVPKDELLIKREMATEAVYNKNGEHLYNPDSSYKMRVSKNITNYYRLKGHNLIKVK